MKYYSIPDNDGLSGLYLNYTENQKRRWINIFLSSVN